MRPGIPLIPILKQQRLGDSSGSKLRLTPRPNSARNSDASTRNDDDRKPWNISTGTSSRPTRSSEGGAGKKPVRSIHHGLGSTGGTGSSGSVGSTPAAPSPAAPSPLSAFWSNIDDLDHELQARHAAATAHLDAAATRWQSSTGKRTANSTPKDGGLFTRTPDFTPQDVFFAQTPDDSPKYYMQDITFSETPVHQGNGVTSMAGAMSSDGLEDGIGQRSTGASEAEWLSEMLQPSPETSPKTGSNRDPPLSEANGHSRGQQGPASESSRGARTPPGIGSRPPRALNGASSAAGARGQREGRPISGSQSDDTVAHLTTRIRQLEGELENAFDALSSRNTATKRLPARRTGSAPPTRWRAAQTAPQATATSASSSRQPPTESWQDPPQLAPRMMCRETLGESEGSPNLDTGMLLLNDVESQGGHFRTDEGSASSSQPSRLRHVCEMMQMERRGLLETLQDVCRQCHVDFEALSDSPQNVASPRTLLNRLCDAHLAMHSRCTTVAEAAAAARERYETGALGCPDLAEADGTVEDISLPTSPVEGVLLGESATATTSSTWRPFAAASAQIRSVLDCTGVSNGGFEALSDEAQNDLLDLIAVAGQMDVALSRSQLQSQEEVAGLLEVPATSVPRSSGELGLFSFSPADWASGSVACMRGLAADQSGSRSPGGARAQSTDSAPESSAGPAQSSVDIQHSSVRSMPAVGRLCELVDEKRQEVAKLQARAECAVTNEEHLDFSSDLSSAREELRLLQEFLGEGVDM